MDLILVEQLFQTMLQFFFILIVKMFMLRGRGGETTTGDGGQIKIPDEGLVHVHVYTTQSKCLDSHNRCAEHRETKTERTLSTNHHMPEQEI